MYYSQYDLDRKIKSSPAIFKNKKKIRQYFDQTRVRIVELRELTETIAKQIKKISNIKLAAYYRDIIYRLSFLLACYDLSRPEFFVNVEKKIKQFLLKKKVDHGELNAFFGVLTTNTTSTLLDQEEIEWLQIVLRAKTARPHLNSPIINQLQVHQKKYGWIGTSEQRDPWSVSYYTKLLLKDLRSPASNIRERIKNKIGKKKVLIRNQKKLLNKLKPTSEIVFLCSLVQEFSHLRLSIRLSWIENGFLMNGIFREIERRFNLSRDTSKSYLQKEMLQLLEKRRRVPVTTITQRKRYVLILKNKSIKLYCGKKSELFSKILLPKINYHNIHEIQGNVANPGFVINTVKIINALSKNQAKEINRMQQGQILVTGMTRPHLIYAMKKASAIITDEGGIASHAAIISRELNIPCIIGTKVATKVLKDGDQVEVDANNGVIKILSN